MLLFSHVIDVYDIISFTKLTLCSLFVAYAFNICLIVIIVNIMSYYYLCDCKMVTWQDILFTLSLLRAKCKMSSWHRTAPTLP